MISLLKSIRVVEQGTFITGPCAGMMLADLGADVIKVESPGTGDPFRSFKGDLYSPHFQAYNRNKRSVAMDLKIAADHELFDRLIAQSDVYIQNFRPGAADRLGAGYQRLSQINPKLIYCSISGFGPTGPYSERPSYDSVAQALSGFLSVMVDPENPRFLGPALADAATGIYAAYGVLGALVERGVSGKGHLVEISMLEAMAHFAIEPFSAYFAQGVAPTSSDRPRLAQAYLLKAKDGKFLATHLSSLEKFWINITTALEAEYLQKDPRFSERSGRMQNYEELGREFNRRFGERPLAEWMLRFEKHDVPFAPMNSIDEVLDDPQVKHLELVVPVTGRKEGATRALRPAVSFDGKHGTWTYPAPLIDEHGEGIRRSLTVGSGWPERGGASKV